MSCGSKNCICCSPKPLEPCIDCSQCPPVDTPDWAVGGKGPSGRGDAGPPGDDGQPGPNGKKGPPAFGAPLIVDLPLTIPGVYVTPVPEGARFLNITMMGGGAVGIGGGNGGGGGGGTFEYPIPLYGVVLPSNITSNVGNVGQATIITMPSGAQIVASAGGNPTGGSVMIDNVIVATGGVLGSEAVWNPPINPFVFGGGGGGAPAALATGGGAGGAIGGTSIGGSGGGGASLMANGMDANSVLIPGPGAGGGGTSAAGPGYIQFVFY